VSRPISARLPFGRFNSAKEARIGSTPVVRRENDRLRARIEHVLKQHPELRDVTDVIAFRQELYVQVGTPFLERIHGKLQERARAIIERRPDLEHHFDD
jgi:hypothetical protein